MITHPEFLKRYWNYYLSLENDLLQLSSYIEICRDNYSTYSIELLKLYQAVCSEVEMVFKELCELDFDARTTITTYCTEMIARYPKITTWEINAFLNEFSFVPFDNWNCAQPSQSLTWWDHYNAVKHNRVQNYRFANLQNVLTALSGLYLLEMMLHRATYESDEKPAGLGKNSSIFRITDWSDPVMSVTPDISFVIKSTTP